MRIGIDYTAAVHQRAGIGRYARSLVRALAQLDRENEYLLLVAGRRLLRGDSGLTHHRSNNYKWEYIACRN